MSDWLDEFTEKPNATPPKAPVAPQPKAAEKPKPAPTYRHDARCLAVIGKNANMLIPWFLMASYCYYFTEHELITDATFDIVSRRLNAEFDSLTHPHKAVAEEYVRNGKTTVMPKDLPLIVQQAANRLIHTNPEALGCIP